MQKNIEKVRVAVKAIGSREITRECRRKNRLRKIGGRSDFLNGNSCARKG